MSSNSLMANPGGLKPAPLRSLSAYFSGPSASAAAALKGGKTEKAAREFESVLLTSLFDGLQKSFSFDAQDETPGAADYRQMGTQALANAVSSGGGIGIARMILSHLHAPKDQGGKSGGE